MSQVVAFMPNLDGPNMRKIDAFAADRNYDIACRFVTWMEADNLLRKGDTLILESLLDLDLSGGYLKGLNTTIDLTDKRGITIVTVRENYVLKDDSMSHIQAGVCFFAQMMANTRYEEDK